MSPKSPAKTGGVATVDSYADNAADNVYGGPGRDTFWVFSGGLLFHRLWPRKFVAELLISGPRYPPLQALAYGSTITTPRG